MKTALYNLKGLDFKSGLFNKSSLIYSHGEYTTIVVLNEAFKLRISFSPRSKSYMEKAFNQERQGDLYSNWNFSSFLEFYFKNVIPSDEISAMADIVFHDTVEISSKVKTYELINSLLGSNTGRESRLKSFKALFPESLQWEACTNPRMMVYKPFSLIQIGPKSKHLFLKVLVGSEEVSTAGIITIDSDQDAAINKQSDSSNFFAMIVAAAPDAYAYDEVTFVPGDIIIYAKHRETTVTYGGQKLLMISEHDVFAVVPDNAYYDFQFSATGDIYQNIRHKFISQKDIEKREANAIGKQAK